MKLQINVDTTDRKSVEKLLKLALTVYKFETGSTKALDERIRKIVNDIINGK